MNRECFALFQANTDLCGQQAGKKNVKVQKKKRRNEEAVGMGDADIVRKWKDHLGSFLPMSGQHTSTRLWVLFASSWAITGDSVRAPARYRQVPSPTLQVPIYEVHE